jgi:hypothetical protein
MRLVDSVKLNSRDGTEEIGSGGNGSCRRTRSGLLDKKMIWPYAPIKGRDLIALVICAAVAVMLLLVAARFPNSANSGFGPDWKCENVPQSEAICVKRRSENPTK